jgi:hypothetical protein
MNKLGVHAFVWAKGWSKEECSRAIGNSAEVGFDLIEIAALDPKSIDVDFARRQLEKAKIGCTTSLGFEANEDISRTSEIASTTSAQTPAVSDPESASASSSSSSSGRRAPSRARR